MGGVGWKKQQLHFVGVSCTYEILSLVGGVFVENTKVLF